MQKRLGGVSAAILGMALAVAQPLLAQAAGGTTPVQHPRLAQMKKMADYLGLTSDQKAQVKPIMKDTMQKVKAVRADTTLTPAARMAKIRDIRKANRQQIMAILTPAQKAKLAALRQQR